MKQLKDIILRTKKSSSIDDYIQEKLNRTKCSIMLEKLKIGSKSKVDANDNELLDEILYILSINDKNPLKYPKDKLDFIKEEIQYWIFKNHVKNVIYVTDKNTLKIYDKYYVNDKNILKYFDTKYNVYQDIVKKYNTSHHIYSNDCCEIRSTNKVFIIYIEEPTHNINLEFYLVKTDEDN